MMVNKVICPGDIARDDNQQGYLRWQYRQRYQQGYLSPRHRHRLQSTRLLNFVLATSRRDDGKEGYMSRRHRQRQWSTKIFVLATSPEMMVNKAICPGEIARDDGQQIICPGDIAR